MLIVQKLEVTVPMPVAFSSAYTSDDGTPMRHMDSAPLPSIRPWKHESPPRP